MTTVQIDPMPLLVHAIQSARQRVEETAQAYAEARAELRALEAHYNQIMQALQAATEAPPPEAPPAPAARTPRGKPGRDQPRPAQPPAGTATAE